MPKLRVALAHHWLVSRGGAETVLYELHRMWPEAPIYTAAYIPDKFPEFAKADVRTTFLDKIPLLKHKHQLFPIFLGLPFKTLDMSEYDLVISSCAAEAKYVKTGANTLHICYCHTPVRYYWSDYEWRLEHMPFGYFNWLGRIVFPLVIGILRRVDYKGAQGVDVYVANSAFIQKRIKRYYHRDSAVIYPPVSTQPLLKTPRTRGNYYVIVSRQVASKRIDLAIDVFNELGLELKVVGIGEELAALKARAKVNISFLGWVPDDERNRLMAGAKAFVFPPEEDFGIVPLEAMAAGTPVIAYSAGGAPEYVTDGETGVLFKEQSPEALIAAVRRFESMQLDNDKIRARAREFDVEVFRLRMREFVDAEWKKFEAKRQS